MKAKLLALLAVVLAVVSCQREPEGLDVNVGGEQTVTINVTIPEAETRAEVDKSAKGVFDNGVLDGAATMRYIFQVFYKGNESEAERMVKYSDGKSVAFDVRLVPDREYTFVVWADVVTAEGAGDNHYDTTDLENITLNGEWNAMDETRDAFTTTATRTYNGSMDLTLKLTRPFAKIRVVTTDIQNLLDLGIKPAKATVTYATETKHRVAFNAVEGKAAAGSENKTHTEYAIAKYTNEWENDESKGAMTLYTDYFFAENDVVKFEFKVYDQNGDLIKQNAFNTDIYAKRNYLTTIKGNILTDGKGFEVKIEDAFAGEIGEDNGETFANVDTAEELLEALENGTENITLDGDIDLNDLLNAGILSTRAATDPTITIATGKESTIDLGGFTLSATSTQTGKNYNMIDVRGTLTVKNGTITTKHEGDNMAWNNSTNVFNVTAGGVLNLEGVTAKNLGGSDMAFVAHLNNWGEVTLNVENSTLESTYIAVRVFNSGNDMNNVTIKNSALNGKYCFWVHNYTKEDFGTEEKALAHQALLNFDIFNGTNTFEFTNSYGAAALYGFTNAIYFTADGNQIVADGVAMNAEGEYLITKAAGLTWFSDQMNNKKNTFAGKTIKVVNDIDMAGVTYYGGSVASYPSYCFKGTFDGGEKVISNLTITVEDDIHGAAALIPTLAGDGTTIKNVILRDVNISSSHYAAGIWGYTTSDNCWINVTNCHVEGGTITGNICNGDNADKVGGIGGIFYDGIVSGCSVKDVTISAYRDAAGIVGWAADSRATIKNNTIENVTINVNNETNYKKYTKRSEYDVNNYVGEGVGKAKLEGNTGEATINWGSIAE